MHRYIYIVSTDNYFDSFQLELESILVQLSIILEGPVPRSHSVRCAFYIFLISSWNFHL